MSADPIQSLTKPMSSSAQSWHLGHGLSLVLDRPRLMAILNLTPDSFFSGSRIVADRSCEAAQQAVDEGADILDIGGESTRPGSLPVPEDEKVARVLPAIRAIRAASGPLREIPISIDTTRSSVADACLRAGANAINDVSAGLDDPDMLGTVARHKAGLVLMHRVKPPADDQYADRYAVPPLTGDVVAPWRAFCASASKRRSPPACREPASSSIQGLALESPSIRTSS
jgi:dihydropteroate synthase